MVYGKELFKLKFLQKTGKKHRILLFKLNKFLLKIPLKCKIFNERNPTTQATKQKSSINFFE